MKLWFKLFLIFSLFPVTSYSKDRIYTMGIVPQFEPQKLNSIWQPIIKAISQISGLKIKIEGSSKIPVFEKKISNGEFDFVYMNPYHMIIANNTQGYLPLLRDHGRKLFGILVVKKGSEFKKIEDLNGTKISFPSPNALGASLLMRADLSTVHKIDFTPIYTQTHSSSYLHVVMGLTKAGGGVQGTLNRQSDEIKSKLRVIYKTQKLAPHPIAIHPRISNKVKELIKEAFLTLEKSNTGMIMLRKVPILEVKEANMKDYQDLKNMGLEKFYKKME